MYHKNELKVILIEFLFSEDVRKSKIRPAVQLTREYGKHKLSVVAYITSKQPDQIDGDVKVGKGYEKMGLKTESVIRLCKLTNVPKLKIKGELGFLSKEKSEEVRIGLKKLFDI